MDYNKTVHLPQTDFPMRAALPKREPDMLKAFYDKDLYHKMVVRNDGKPRFVLHDGPPYANGNIHIGTALNKILKDMIVKHRNMTGWCAPYVPGWDTHGLPIESAVLKDKKVKRDEMTTAQFRTKCREYAESYIEKMTGQFQRLGVLGEWENPYITLLPEFEAKQIEVFGKMAEKGLIYKGMKPVYWCPFDQTALAEAEIEYADDPCTTIFVKFPVADDKGKLGQYADLSRTYFVIWTTTPWTIPGNYAICLNAEFDYVLLQVPSGDVYVLAQDLAESVCKAAGIDYAACTVLATLKGSAFELMRAKHPLFDRESVILNSEHVTLDAGSGCVHTAPGFGAEDFQICQQYDKAGLTHIGVPVPVNAKGVMTDERYNGQFYAKGNDMVVADLEAEGFLVAKENITHSYPHCWRCKHPIIYRATEQWFCSVDAIKDAAVKACDSIQWKPEWGKERMTSMITERNDWCISRQRVWGVPIPIFYCEDCGADIVTPETIAHVAGLFREHGSNVWFDREAAELLPQGFVCPKCGKAHFTKETDIMDVWFDSGSTWAAVAAERPYLKYPADLYLEGPVPRLVPVEHAHLHRRERCGPLQADRHPRLDGGRRGQGHAQVPGQRRLPRRGHQGLRRRHAPPVGGLRRLHPGHAHLQGHHEAALPGLSENPQHRPLHAGQPVRLRARPGSGAGGKPDGAGPLRPAHLQRAGQDRPRRLRPL